jgi:hypothetical protein
MPVANRVVPVQADQCRNALTSRRCVGSPRFCFRNVTAVNPLVGDAFLQSSAGEQVGASKSFGNQRSTSIRAVSPSSSGRAGALPTKQRSKYPRLTLGCTCRNVDCGARRLRALAATAAERYASCPTTRRALGSTRDQSQSSREPTSRARTPRRLETTGERAGARADRSGPFSAQGGQTAVGVFVTGFRLRRKITMSLG